VLFLRSEAFSDLLIRLQIDMLWFHCKDFLVLNYLHTVILENMFIFKLNYVLLHLILYYIYVLVPSVKMATLCSADKFKREYYHHGNNNIEIRKIFTVFYITKILSHIRYL